MSFAIKLISNKIDEYGVKTIFKEKYYSQTIERLLATDFEKLILLCDGEDPDEIDLSFTLLEAETKLEEIKPLINTRVKPGKPFVSAKIVEYPEVE